ncbi:hypothetical protein AMECASPLE_036772 [Ameca splendens]|uniref:Secreted protein n=1 Tax=Ameca splendens TaxID=208324 RepID=A0ABV0ZGG0_9TELE
MILVYSVCWFMFCFICKMFLRFDCVHVFLFSSSYVLFPLPATVSLQSASLVYLAKPSLSMSMPATASTCVSVGFCPVKPCYPPSHTTSCQSVFGSTPRGIHDKNLFQKSIS